MTIEQIQGLAAGEWIVAAIAMILIGFSRTGFRGTAFFSVPIFAAAFGARPSTSVVLLMYITADLVAVRRFSRTVDWKIVLRLTPWVAIGVVAGTVFGNYINDRLFARVIAGIVILSLILTITREFRDNPVDLRGKRWLSPPLGIAGGFTSMVGNAAGSIMTPYILSLGLDKDRFMGTVAWFFFLMNLSKLPSHIFIWKTISGPSLLVNAIAVVPILVGTFIGSKLYGHVGERTFRIISYGLAGAGAVRLLVM